MNHQHLPERSSAPSVEVPAVWWHRDQADQNQSRNPRNEPNLLRDNHFQRNSDQLFLCIHAAQLDKYFRISGTGLTNIFHSHERN